MRASGVVPGGYDRAASTMALAPLLEQFGVSLDSLLTESGLPIGLFEHPDNLIPFREGTRLMGLCADRTGCPHFGLLMGEATPLEAYGIVADLMKSAADVRAALKLMCRFMTLADGGGMLTLSETISSPASAIPSTNRVSNGPMYSATTPWLYRSACCAHFAGASGDRMRSSFRAAAQPISSPMSPSSRHPCDSMSNRPQ